MITRIARRSRAWTPVGHALVALAIGVAPMMGATQQQGQAENQHAVPATDPQAAPAPIEQEVCAQCHAVDALRSGVHRAEVACLACHAEDRHRAMPVDSARAARARSALCVGCHADVQSAHPTIEGAPVCTDCHSVHVDSAGTSTAVIATRCEACHASEFSKYAQGAHAGAIADPPNPDLPSCVTCHPSHGPALSVAAARSEATALCVACHSNEELTRRYGLPSMVGRSYADDFHGRTMHFLGLNVGRTAPPDVLICADCHGAHDVSWVDRGDMTAVCLGCHEKADPKIAGAWLGHQPISRSNGAIVWAIRLFYYVFIPLVLGGLLIHILFDIRHQLRNRRAQAPAGADSKIMVTRFRPIERIEHLLSAASFTLLVLTGLPQAWPSSSVGNWLIRLFGGIVSTRLIHRATGVLFVALLVLHVGRAVFGIIRYRKLPVMFATRYDFAAVRKTLRHVLGRGPAPKMGKFDFREKFEYWGLFLGGTLMTVTGLLLMFPDGASRLLPGMFLAGARVVHGLEATFAVLVVLLWHSWGVILRPEVFPLDTSIFTGKISLHRLKEEHALEYERIFGTDHADGVGATELTPRGREGRPAVGARRDAAVEPT